MKIVLVADIHIRIDDQPIFATWEYQRLMLLKDEIVKQGANEVWILGDLFDRNKPTVADIKAAFRFTEGLTVRYIEGNHERIDKHTYLLAQLEDVLQMIRLPNFQEIEGVSITAFGHDELDKILQASDSDILLSHFRWSHSVFGQGEFKPMEEKRIASKYSSVILGDIHYPYQPLSNVQYISSPYGITYSASGDYGIALLELSKGNHNLTLIPLNLPNKITVTTRISLVNGLMESVENNQNKYKILVELLLKDIDAFNRLKPPSNVTLIPKVIDASKTTKAVEKISVSTNIKDVLIGALDLPQDSREYIKDILKEI